MTRDVPGLGQKRPAEHGLQAVSCWPDSVPGGHGTAAVEPSGQKLPAGHGTVAFGCAQ